MRERWSLNFSKINRQYFWDPSPFKCRCRHMPTFILFLSLPLSAYADLRDVFRFAEISFTYLPMSANSDNLTVKNGLNELIFGTYGPWVNTWQLHFIIFEKFYFRGLGRVSSAKIRQNS